MWYKCLDMNSPVIKVLSLSDKVLDNIYSNSVIDHHKHINLIIGCGDLPYYYLNFVQNALKVPLFFVRGNHGNLVEHGVDGPKSAPQAGIDLHRIVINHEGLLLAGMEGSIRYKPGPFMYTQADMWLNVLALIPRLLLNRVNYGRFLDVFVTHSPPWGVHDQKDWAHQGFKAFSWLLAVFKPAYHFHGHIHKYYGDEITETHFHETRVINTYGYKETLLKLGNHTQPSQPSHHSAEKIKR